MREEKRGGEETEWEERKGGEKGKDRVRGDLRRQRRLSERGEKESREEWKGGEEIK